MLTVWQDAEDGRINEEERDKLLKGLPHPDDTSFVPDIDNDNDNEGQSDGAQVQSDEAEEEE